MGSYSSPDSHRSMIFDEVRNTAYADALEKLVTPDSVVLDLGSGLGLHGLMAAARGARHVYLVDPSPVSEIAREVANVNGLGDKVTVIRKPVQYAKLSEKVDIIVSVFTGNFLLGEDLLPYLFHARDKFLKPSGVLIPDCGEMRVVPVSAPKYHEKRIGRWSGSSQSISFEPVRRFAANCVYHDGAGNRDADFLAEAATIARFDFNTATHAACSGEAGFRVTKEGFCHGFVGWFRMRLGDQWLSTSPLKPAMHWSQIFLPLDPPLQLEMGEEVVLKLARPLQGNWTWATRHRGTVQKRSTFLSRKHSQSEFHSRIRTNVPALSDSGEFAKFVIELINGNNSVGTIIEKAATRFGGRFGSPEMLQSRVQSIIASYGK